MTIRRVRAPFEFRGHTLDDFQIEAIIALQQDMSTLVSAPTGTGKSLIADYLVDDSLKLGRTVIYTAPIKALVNQKYRDFRATFGAGSTGILTGDLSENPDASLLVMTTEVLRNILLRDGRAKARTPGRLRADWMVFDEIHYINHPERGTVWEEAILLLPKPFRLLGLSATVPNIDQLADWLEQVQGEPVASIVGDERAVPLRHFYFTDDGRAMGHADTWEYVTGGDLKAQTLRMDEHPRTVRLPRGDDAPSRHVDIVAYVSRERLFPCIYFALNRRACERMARELARRRNFLRPHEREAVHVTVRRILQQARLRPKDVPGLTAMQDLWYRGIGVHHAGLVPVVKHIAEHLLERRILRIVYATETFAVGVNMPVRTVCFDSVVKFDGRRRRLLTQQEFLQMAGRAGRRGLDREGTVLIRADAEHMAETGGRDWEKAALEPITSRLNVSYSTILNLIERFEHARRGSPEPAATTEHGRPLTRALAEQLEPLIAKPTAPPEGEQVAPVSAPSIQPRAAEEVRRHAAEAAGPLAAEAVGPLAAEQLGPIAPRVATWLARSLCVMQSDEPVVTTARLTKQFAEKAGELRRLGYLPPNAAASATSSSANHRGTRGDGDTRTPPLTAKGLFCRGIWIKELLVTELAFDGTLHELSPAELAGWAAATVWEPRPHDNQLPPAAPGWLAAVQLAGDRIMRWTGPKERASLTVEGRVAPVVTFWATAATAATVSDSDLAKLLRGYPLEAGDFVALCRQAVDLLQQIAEAAGDVVELDGHAPDHLIQLQERATAAVAAVDRDVVRASRNF